MPFDMILSIHLFVKVVIKLPEEPALNAQKLNMVHTIDHLLEPYCVEDLKCRVCILSFTLAKIKMI